MQQQQQQQQRFRFLSSLVQLGTVVPLASSCWTVHHDWTRRSRIISFPFLDGSTVYQRRRRWAAMSVWCTVTVDNTLQAGCGRLCEATAGVAAHIEGLGRGMKALARLRRRREQKQKPAADLPPPLTPPDPPSASNTPTSSFSPHPSSAPATTRPPDPTHPSLEPDDVSPTSAPVGGTQQTAILDGRGQITFNLQLLTDQGIVICPGFHRDQQAFTSTALLAALRPSPPPTDSPAQPQQPAALPSLPDSVDVETVYSPTLLPSPPGTRGEDGSGSSASTISSSAPLDELTVSFAKGAFSLVDTPTAAAAASTQSAAVSNGSSSSSAAPSQSTTAVATAALKRLALTSWRSANVAHSVAAGNDSENAAAAFPPTSALPPAAQGEAGTGSSFEEEDAVSGLHSSSAHPTSVSGSATMPARLHSAPIKPGIVEERPAQPSVASSSEAVSQNQTATIPPPASVTSVSSASSPKAASPVSIASSASFSPFSLPAALLSSVSSWLFRPTPPQPTDPTTTPTAATPPPSPPPPPPPPPPYAATLQRVVIIGVHGWSLFGGMLGDKPLLVSSRFCYYIQHALLRYMRTLSPCGSRPPLHITCIPLYGHGRVEDRVSMYVESQLPQYADELRQADHVIIACHSQGCMVTSSLLALLLLTANPPLTLPAPPHISILMLAGLHHGPFPDLPTDMYPPTKELLSYSHFHSTHSQLHIERMHRLLAAGVRVLLVGSVHDAVVPLYSSLGQLLGRSSNLLRAMYVDYQHYQPDFLYSFLSLALYLANRPPTTNQQSVGSAAGSDVLTHLSGFLRGSLLEKAGGAHSAMHRLVDVYGLAVEWAMSGSGDVVSEPAASIGGGGTAGGYSGVMWSSYLTDGFTLGKLNRHLLVWSVRGMLLELEGRRGEQGLDVDDERRRLSALFVEWAPKTKNLRALRETLAAVFDSNRTIHIQSSL